MNESSLAEISNDLHIAKLGIDGHIYFYNFIYLFCAVVQACFLSLQRAEAPL